MRVLLIAMNAFRGVMSKRALYIWAAAIVLMLLRSVPALSSQGRSPEQLLFQRSLAVSNVLDMWAILSVAAVMFIGAAAVGSDISSRILTTVLARPIRRWELLTGKWLGIVAFCVVTLALGITLAATLAAYLGITIERDVLAIAATRTVASIMVFGAVAVALSAVAVSGVAAALTVLLAFSPPLISLLLDEPGRVQRAAGVALDNLTPPPYTTHYLGVAWAPFPPRPSGFRGAPQQRRRLQIDYPKERKEAGLTLVYAAAYFAIGCAAFSRRDVRIG